MAGNVVNTDAIILLQQGCTRTYIPLSEDQLAVICLHSEWRIKH